MPIERKWLNPPARRNAAEHVIAKFGGQTRLARLLGKPQSSIEHWARIGFIPKKWHEKVLNLARHDGVPITRGELRRRNDGKNRGPTGRNVIRDGSSVSRAIAVLRERGAPLRLETIVEQILEKFNQPVNKGTLGGMLAAYVKAEQMFCRPERGKYGLIEWADDSDSG
jgi:hypothetical protein